MVFACCVPTCKNTNKNISVHLFPKDTELFALWLKKIGREDLETKSVASVRKSYRVCDAHFSDKASYTGMWNKSRLLRNAVPDLHLPGGDQNDNMPISSTDISPTDPGLPSVSHEVPPHTPVSRHVQEVVSSSTIERDNMRISSTDISPTDPELPSVSHEVPPQTPITHVQEVMSSSTIGRGLLSHTGTKRVSDLTPKARTFYKIAKGLKRCSKRLNFKCSNLKQQLRRAETLLNPGLLQGRVNEATLHFISTQLRCQQQQPKGRRYSLDEKILFLSFMKHSPKGYRLMQKMFAAPSRKTLTNLLQKVPFGPGINKAIMKSLKNSLENMKPRDKYCSILFDEISISPSLHYSRGDDNIIGFEDNGVSNGRTSIIADIQMSIT